MSKGAVATAKAMTLVEARRPMIRFDLVRSMIFHSLFFGAAPGRSGSNRPCIASFNPTTREAEISSKPEEKKAIGPAFRDSQYASYGYPIFNLKIDSHFE